LKCIAIGGYFESYDFIHKFIECCRELEEITIYDIFDQLSLTHSEFVAIASLPHLKSLDLKSCKFEDDGVSILAGCMRLRHLRGDYLKMSGELLREIGGNLVSLKCRSRMEEIEGIVEFCPNLEDLDIQIEGNLGYRKDDITRRLKKLSKLKINRWIRLGTDWEGEGKPYGARS
jgi:hypothetical protein